jgi:hypothetical protein
MVFLLDTSKTLAFLGIGNFFGLTALFPLTLDNWQYLLIIISIIQLNFPLVTLFGKIPTILNTNLDNHKKDKLNEI